jgi:hypothetical protein
VNDFPLEGHPTPAQRRRLGRWLADLRVVCDNHHLILDTDGSEFRIIDLERDTVIGVGLAYLLDERGHITALDCDGSVLDGVWLVDTPEGLREQREIPT